MEDKRRMKWQVDFDSFFNVFSTFVIDGNIDDIQPLVQPDDSLEYVRMDDYLIRTLSENRESDKKCVIVYDPTESDDKRFYIAGEFTETLKESDDPDAEPEYERVYSDRLAQHFWEILHEDELEEQMIGHNAGGATLDALRLLQNTEGRLWYEVDVDGEICYLYSGYAEESSWRNWITRFFAKLF